MPAPNPLSKYNGKPCVNGHGTLRYKAGGACVQCSNSRSAMKWRKTDEWKKQRREKYATTEGRADRKDRQYKKLYGLSLEQVNSIAASQNFKCALCGERAAKVVDHCHRSGRVRELLCTGCNLGLGGFKDNPEFLMRAVAYLRKHGD